MFEAEDHGRERRERSLLSLGRARPSETKSPVPDIDDDVDAATRHRLARSRREATPNPLLTALSQKSDEKLQAPDSERGWRSPPAADPAKVHWSIGDLIPGGLSRRPGKEKFERAQEEWEDFDRAAVEASGSMRRQAGDEPPGDVTRATDRPPPDLSADPDLYWRPLIDPMRVVTGIANSRMLILTTTILGALLGIAIAVSTPKQYEGVAELLIDPRDLKIVDRDLTQSGLPSDATMAIVENQVRVLSSGTVLNKVVDKLNLTADPEFNGEGAGSFGNPIAILRSLLSSGDTGSEGDNRRALAVGNLAESLTVERGGKTFVVVITAKTQNPEKSTLIANTLTDVFLQTYGEIQSDTAGRAADELTSRLDQLRADVEAAERKVEAYKNENDIIDAQGRLISDDEMVKLNEQLSIARARTIELNAKAASAREIDVNAVLSGTLPEQINSNVMTELRSQYASLKQEADRLTVRLGPRHPERLAIEAQLAGAREQIQTELRRIISSNQVELRRAVQLEQDLASRLAQVKVRQGGVSEDLITLRELERGAATKRAVYESFLLRARETGEQRDLNTANMSVISKAYPPLEPVGPSRSTIALTGMMLGFMAGVGIGGARGAIQSLRENANPSGPRDPRPSGGSGGPAGGGRWREPQPRTPKTEPSPRPDAPSKKRRDAWMLLSEAEPEWTGGSAKPAVAAHANHNTPAAAAPQEPVVPVSQPMGPGNAVPLSAAPIYQQPAHAPMQQVLMPQQMPLYVPPMYQPWQSLPMQAPYGYMPVMPQPTPVAMPYIAYPAAHPQAAVMTAHSAPPQPQSFGAVDPVGGSSAKPRTPIDEVRESLREFREAVLDISQNRVRRRHS